MNIWFYKILYTLISKFYSRNSEFLFYICGDIFLISWEFYLFSLELLAMLIDFSSEIFCLALSFSTTNDKMQDFNIPNEVYLHEDEDRMHDFYKR